METTWFCLVGFMLTMFVLLDGFDFGAGMLHLLVARNSQERATVLRTVGPVWDGNEVWLLAAGGALFCAFPDVLATAFSGFYLPLMMVLWLLTGRALGIELRHQIAHPVWTSIWDVVFSVSSGLLALFFGVALGNVVRGVPFAPDRTFFAPLWADTASGSPVGILDPYTVLAGLTTTAALGHHGALWLVLKTEGDLQERARRAARQTSWAAAIFAVIATIWTRSVQPHTVTRFGDHPWGYLFPLFAIGGLVAAVLCRRRKQDLQAFLGSSLFLAGMMASVAFSLYPYLLPGIDRVSGLTVDNAAAAPAGLRTALAWWIPGIVPVLIGFAFIYRRFAGKIGAPEDGY